MAAAAGGERDRGSGGVGRATLERLEALIAQQELAAAEELAHRVRADTPWVGAYALGSIAQARGDWYAAERHLAAAISERPDIPRLLSSLAEIRLRLERGIDETRKLLDRALAAEPGHAPSLLALARIERDAGDVAAAVALLERALAADPDHVRAHYYRLALISGTEVPDAELANLRRVLEDRDRTREDRGVAGFALAKAEFDRGDWDAAWSHCHAANRLLHAVRARSGPHPGEVLAGWAARVDPALFAARAAPAAEAPAPLICIVGPSRAGKSLVESLFARHPEVAPVGESVRLGRAISAHVGDSLREACDYVQAATPAGVTAEAHAVADAIWHYGAPPPAGTRYLALTIPDQVWRLGLVGIWFPRTPIVFCYRDALDQGVSSYFRYYARANKEAFDLREIGLHTGAYERLMAYWQEHLPNPMMAVRYEELVADPAAHAEALYRQAGLDWDPAYLDAGAELAPWTDNLGPGQSLDAPGPVRDDFVGIGAHFRDRLDPLVESYRAGHVRADATLDGLAHGSEPLRDAAGAMATENNAEEEPMNPILIERFGSVSLRKGLIRLQTIAGGADGQERPTGELMLQRDQLDQLIAGLQKIRDQLEEGDSA